MAWRQTIFLVSSMLLHLSCTAALQGGDEGTSTDAPIVQVKDQGGTAKTDAQTTREEASGGGTATSTVEESPVAGTVPALPESLPGAEECLAAEPFLCDAELAMTRYVNELRQAQPKFTYNAKIAYVACAWSKSQAEAGKTSHEGFPDKRVALYASAFGAQDAPTILAENTVSYDDCQGKASADDVAKALFDLWAASSKHRDLMISNTREFGIGVWKSGTVYYATQIFGN